MKIHNREYFKKELEKWTKTFPNKTPEQVLASVGSGSGSSDITNLQREKAELERKLKEWTDCFHGESAINVYNSYQDLKNKELSVEELKRMEMEVNAYIKEKVETIDDEEKQKDEIKDLKWNLSVLERKIANLAEEKEHAQNIKSDLETEYNKLKELFGESTLEREKLVQECKKLNKLISERENEWLKDKVIKEEEWEELAKKIEKVKKKAKDRKLDIQRMKRSIDELEIELKTERKRSEEEKKELQERIKNTQDNLKNTNDELVKKGNDLKNLKEVELQNLQSKVQELERKEFNELEAKIVDEIKNVNDLFLKSERVFTETNEKEQMQNCLRDYSEGYSKVLEMWDEAKTPHLTFRSSFSDFWIGSERLTRQASNLKWVLGESVEHIDVLDKSVRNFKRMYEETLELLNTSRIEKGNLEVQIVELKEDIKELKEKVAALEELVENLNTDKSNLESSKETLRQRVNTLTIDVNNLRPQANKVSGLESQIHHLQSVSDSLRSKSIDNLNKEVVLCSINKAGYRDDVEVRVMEKSYGSSTVRSVKWDYRKGGWYVAEEGTNMCVIDIFGKEVWEVALVRVIDSNLNATAFTTAHR